MAVETMEFIAATARMIRAAGRRVAVADEPELAALNELRHTIDEALHTAVHGQRAGGRSVVVSDRRRHRHHQTSRA